jgi:hypothetical protein
MGKDGGRIWLSTSWANVTGLSLTLPPNTTWFLQAQLTGQIVSSASGAGDYLSARYFDGSTVYGTPANFATTACFLRFLLARADDAPTARRVAFTVAVLPCCQLC